MASCPDLLIHVKVVRQWTLVTYEAVEGEYVADAMKNEGKGRIVKRELLAEDGHVVGSFYPVLPPTPEEIIEARRQLREPLRVDL